MKIVYLFATVLLAVIACSQLAMAQIPRTISYQGVLTNDLGVPKPDGSYSLTFRLYDALSSGTVLWTEAKTLDVKRGLFGTILGDQVVIPDAVIFDKPYWLSIQVAAEPELSPRIPLTAVGYSLYSLRAETSMVSMVSMKAETSMVSLVSVGDTLWTKSGPDIYRMGGNVGIGTTTPMAPMHVANLIRVGKDPTYPSVYGEIKHEGSSSGFILNANANGGWADMHLQTDDVTRIFIESGGKVGIGTTTPQRTLDVDGQVHVKDSLIIGSATQNGRLRIHRNGVTNPLININTDGSYGGNISVYDEVGNITSRIEGDNSGEGGILTVMRDALGNNGFEVNGNWSNSKNAHVRISGANRFMIFNTNSSKNNSVILPDSSISADEMFDEPGIASDFDAAATIAIGGSTVITNIASASVTVPGPGYIVARATGYATIYGTQIGNVFMGIETSPTTAPSPFTLYGAQDYTYPSTEYFWSSLSFEDIFTVGSSGTYTYYMNAYRGWDGGTATISNSQLTLIYIPTSYGTVTAAVSQNEAQQFQSATPIDMPSDGSQNAVSTEKMYKVDLRELELKAAKARAAAEKAERELMEAKVEDQNGDDSLDKR